MKANPTVSITLRSDKKRKDGLCPINYLVRYQGKTYKFPSEYSVVESHWNTKRKSPKDMRLANILEEKQIGFREWVIKMNSESRPISLDSIRNVFNGKSHDSVLEYYEQIISKNAKGFEKNTIKGYRTNLNALEEFRKDLYFEDIDIQFIESFDHFLRTERGISAGGRFGHHKNLKSILNKAKRDKRIKENPYSEHKFEMPKPPSRTIFLDEKEVALIENLKIAPNNKRLLRTRELFLFACYTSLRYSDVISLSWDEIEIIKDEEFVIKTQKKTKRQVSIPLAKKALAILNKRRKLAQEKVFDTISNQKLNYNLKQLCREAKISKKVTFHIGRHTCASVAVAQRKDIYVLSKIMGHSSIRQTEMYAKLNPESLIGFFD